MLHISKVVTMEFKEYLSMNLGYPLEPGQW